MAKILISYDLNQPGRDYPRITERIKQIGAAWCHPLESVWIVMVDAQVTAVRDDLLRHVDQSSKLLVVDITSDPMAWSGMATDASRWLSAN